MKTHLTSILLLLFSPLFMLGQNLKSELWGDYYFLNGEYQKAISFFESYSGEKPLSSRRHWALAYLKQDQKEKAMLTYTPVANSVEARVEDYYIYADLLTRQPKLAKEYRNKAYRLPWDKAEVSLEAKGVSDTLSPYAIQNLNGNTKAADFGMIYPISKKDSWVFFLSQQHSKGKSNGVLKRYQSQYPIYDFYQAVIDLQTFSLKQKEPLRKTVNSYFQEGPGGVDAKGEKFYFTQSAKRLDKGNNVLLKLYAINLNKIEMQTVAEEIKVVPQASSAMHPSVSSDGKQLYFASDMPGGYGGMDLYRAVWREGQFQDVENLGPDINTTADEVFPFIHYKDILFYATNATGGQGKLDVMMAHNRIEKRWESFLLKQNINTGKDDFCFGIDPDQNWAWFSSNRKGGKGEDDLYLFSFTPKIEGVSDHYFYAPSDTLVVALENVQKNDLLLAYTQDPLQRLVEREVVLETSPKNGHLQLNANGTFWYKNKAPLQVKDSFAYRVQTVKGSSKPVWVYLQREAVNELPEELKKPLLPIYYALDASDILAQYKSRVEDVIRLMKKYPDLEIELRSYTDCRGRSDYNLALSKRRTNVILNYVKKHIPRPERIYGDGYGERNNRFGPTEKSCKNLREAEHQENRKTTFSVIRIKK